MTAIYALPGAMHGGGKTLTLMSAEGSTRLAEMLTGCRDIHLVVHAGNLPLLIEQCNGGLSRVIRDFSICVLAKSEWDRQKLLLGDRIYV